MEEQKINNKGIIPNLQTIRFEDKTIYYKNANLMMGIFQGVGISQTILDNSNDYDEILINFKGNGNSEKYDGIYLVKLDSFRKSPKKYYNTSEDLQRFVSFKDMKKIVTNFSGKVTPCGVK